MNFIIRSLIKIGILKKDLDYHLLRALMVMICLFFGYQKWFAYEAQALIPYISHGPPIFWLYPVFGMRGATYFLGIPEWLFGALLLAGFWNKKAGILEREGRRTPEAVPRTIRESCAQGSARPLTDLVTITTPTGTLSSNLNFTTLP